MYKTLIVDDSKILRTMLKNHLFEADEGFKEESISEATNGKEALELLKKEKFDIILSDINMPEMDGVEFSKEVKSSPETKDIKIVIMTSRTSDTQKEELEKLGIDLFLNKPVQKDTVGKLIITMIRQESAKHILDEKFKDKNLKDLILWLVEDFFYKNLDFREFTNKNFEERHTEIFADSFFITLEEKLEDSIEGKVLGEYLANRYTKQIVEALADIFLFEIGGGDSNVKKFLSYYTGGIKVIDGERYKIPSILDKDGAVVNSSTISIISQQYYKQKTYMQTLALSIEKSLEELEEAKKSLEEAKGEIEGEEESNIECKEEFVRENAKEIRVLSERVQEKEQKLAQGKQRLLKHQQLSAQYKPRYKMLITAFKDALLRKKEKVEFK